MIWPFAGKASQSQSGGSGNTQNIGMAPADFIAVMDRKDAEIKQLIDQKFAEIEKRHQTDISLQSLRRDLAELQTQHAGLQARMANPAAAYAEHIHRGTQIEQLLQDTAIMQGLGENRILSALQGFEGLEYQEIDALLAETEENGLLIAANAAFGRGLIAEDAIRWNDAATHYARAATLAPDFERLFRATYFAQRAGRFDQAERFATDLVATARISQIPQNLSLSLDRQAAVLQSKGQYPAAEALFSEALGITRATIGEGHQGYAAGLNNLAGVVRAQGRHFEAEGLYRQALAIDRATIGEAHPDHANRLNNLALVIKAQGRSPEAEGLYRQALDIDRATIGEAHPVYATHLNNLASVVQDQGRYPEAVGLYRQAIAIDRATIGEGHPSYAIHLGNLASCLAGQGKSEEARPLLDQALAILRATLPADHPHIAETLGHIATLPTP